MSDVTGARELAQEFASMAGRVPDEVRKVVQVGALKIKQGMQRDASGSAHFGQLAGSISYSLWGNAGASRAEIGPVDDGGSGELANIAYIGTARGGGTLDLTGPLKAETPAILEHIDRIIGGGRP